MHYVPGWDCHGLPVELKANKNHLQNPLEIRKNGTNVGYSLRISTTIPNDRILLHFHFSCAARLCAEQAMVEQRGAFMSWGVTADWSDAGCYTTNRTSYMKNQLWQFIKLYEKGIVFRDFMPVYWSPSSRYGMLNVVYVYPLLFLYLVS